jgi:hypothetical protein
MKKSSKWIIFTVLGASCLGAEFFRGSVSKQVLVYRSGGIIKRVEEYRIKQGRLPEDLEAIGIKEKLEGPIYYEKKNDKDYIVWFGQSLGESCTYSSQSKEWLLTD